MSDQVRATANPAAKKAVMRGGGVRVGPNGTLSRAGAANAAAAQGGGRWLSPQRRAKIINLFISIATTTFSVLLARIVYTHLGLPFAFIVVSILFKFGALSLVENFLQMVLEIFHSDKQRFADALRRADTMAQPVTEKNGESGSGELIHYGFSCMQGWRRSMEDDHAMVIDPSGRSGFFAIFDGHCGQQVANLCGANLYDFVKKTAYFRDRDYRNALKEGFLTLDKNIYSNNPLERSGCTAVSLYISEGCKELYCANAGDSRCVLCRDGEPLPLSDDHKPYNIIEELRIRRAGGFVYNRRVNGVLALSRAIGDFSFKRTAHVPWEQQAVTSEPELKVAQLSQERDEFAVLACDGIWDVMSNKQVVDFVRMRIENNMPLQVICEEIMMSCLSSHPFGLGCDNMSVMVVLFLTNAKSLEYARRQDKGKATTAPSDDGDPVASVSSSKPPPIPTPAASTEAIPLEKTVIPDAPTNATNICESPSSTEPSEKSKAAVEKDDKESDTAEEAPQEMQLTSPSARQAPSGFPGAAPEKRDDASKEL